MNVLMKTTADYELKKEQLGLHVCTNTGTSFISEIEMTNLRNMIIRGMVSAKVRRAQQAWKWQNDDNDKKKQP